MAPDSPFTYDQHQANLVIAAQMAAEEAALRANLVQRLTEAFSYAISRQDSAPSTLAEMAIKVFETYIGDGITHGMGAVT